MNVDELPREPRHRAPDAHAGVCAQGAPDPIHGGTPDAYRSRAAAHAPGTSGESVPAKGAGTATLAALRGRRQRSSNRAVRSPSSPRHFPAAGAAPSPALPEAAARA